MLDLGRAVREARWASKAHGVTGIIIGGNTVPLQAGLGQEPAQVLTWHVHGIEFRAGEGYNKRRRRAVDLAVWHWTGGEREPDEVAGELKRRKLGIEFAISRTGVVYQFCDPLTVDTADAGEVNARSVGIELVSYGMRSALRLWVAPKLGRDRPTQQVSIQGKQRTVATFYAPQIIAARQLAVALSRALPIPPVVPLGVTGHVIDRVLVDSHMLAFRGHVGHYHVSRKKSDPGPALLEEIGDALRPVAIT